MRRRAPAADGRAHAGATCSTPSPYPARRRARSRPDSVCASKRPVVEDSAMSANPTERVGFLGLGIMGSRMAAHVARTGYPLSVWTRTPGKAVAWAAEHGAQACDTPAAVAAGSDSVISMVVDAEQVAGVMLGDDG